MEPVAYDSVMPLAIMYVRFTFSSMNVQYPQSLAVNGNIQAVHVRNESITFQHVQNE